MAPAAVVTRGPYLQSAGTDRITICWRTDVPTTSEVAFGLLQSPLPQSVSTPGTRTDHAVTLTALNASTRYFYRVKGIPETGAPCRCGRIAVIGSEHLPRQRTSSPTRIWVVGDSGYQTNYADFAFSAYMNANAAVWQIHRCLSHAGGQRLSRTAPIRSIKALCSTDTRASSRNTPMWSTIGNHDDTTVPACPAGTLLFDLPFSNRGRMWRSRFGNRTLLFVQSREHSLHLH